MNIEITIDGKPVTGELYEQMAAQITPLIPRKERRGIVTYPKNGEVVYGVEGVCGWYGLYVRNLERKER